MSDETAGDLSDFLPMPHDPRILLAVPQNGRAKLDSLWQLTVRITKLLDEVREPLIGQIKLAWWRDMMAMLAEKPENLPKGEPLLAEMQVHWRGEAGLGALVDAAEAVLMAEDQAERVKAASEFGDQLFLLSGRAISAQPLPSSGARWGLLWAAYVHRGSEEAPEFLEAGKAASTPAKSTFGKGAKSLMMLDRLAAQILSENGARDYRREGMILLRVGLFGR